MDYPFHEIARLPAPGDNCAIATRHLEHGTRVRWGTETFVLSHTTLEGHRFAVRPIAAGEALFSWGHPFGITLLRIAAGEYVINAETLDALHERSLDFALPDEPNFRNDSPPDRVDRTRFAVSTQVPRYDEPRSFWGYRRTPDRGVGTRNAIVVLGITSRAASFARALAQRLDNRTRGLENVDAITSVAHTEGSGGDSLNNYALLLRTLAGWMVHPNVGAVLAVDAPGDAITRNELEKFLRAENYPLDNVLHAWLSLTGNFYDDLARGAQQIEAWLDAVNRTPRTLESVEHLKIALQCGGSDAFSGVSGNPLAAAVAREILRYGGAANLAETDELMGAEPYILQHVRDAKTARDFLETLDRFRALLAQHGVSPEGNPSGGNRYRGLYNITLKALGAAMKKDPAVRLDAVIKYAERITGNGFYFMDSPGNDLESIAGQIASGCNLIFFVTGNGSVTNFPFVPTIKIVTTTGRYKLLSNEMDVNAGAYLDGIPLEELTRTTLELTLRAASGERTRGERAGHSQVSIWRNWRQTNARLSNLECEPPLPNGEAIVLQGRAFEPRAFAFPVLSAGQHIATEFVGLIVPTSLCASQVARIGAERLNRIWHGHTPQVARFSTLIHTEGCGVSGNSYLALYKRTLLNYMRHPMVRFGLFLEHGCEITHNDAMRQQLIKEGRSTNHFGWASIQLDGGMDAVLEKIETWFHRRLEAAEAPHAERVGPGHLSIGLAITGVPSPPLAETLATFTHQMVAAGGTIVVPSHSALPSGLLLLQHLFGEQIPVPSLAYGQFAACPGFHIMDAPSTHWVETLTGLGATGVQLILAFADTPQQVHPFIPVVQFTTAEPGEKKEGDFDVVLDSASEMWGNAIWRSLERFLTPETRALRFYPDNSDFQITRSWSGITV